MPRKPAKTGVTIKHELTETEIPIRLDKETMEFVAYYGSLRFEALTASELETQVLQTIDQRTSLDFIPIITVKIQRSLTCSDAHAKIEIGIDRFFYATARSASDSEPRHLRIEWEAHKAGEIHRTKRWRSYYYPYLPEQIALPFSLGRAAYTTVYLPYTEETWESLNKMVRAIHDVGPILLQWAEDGAPINGLRLPWADQADNSELPAS